MENRRLRMEGRREAQRVCRRHQNGARTFLSAAWRQTPVVADATDGVFAILLRTRMSALRSNQDTTLGFVAVVTFCKTGATGEPCPAPAAPRSLRSQLTPIRRIALLCPAGVSLRGGRLGWSAEHPLGALEKHEIRAERVLGAPVSQWSRIRRNAMARTDPVRRDGNGMIQSALERREAPRRFQKHENENCVPLVRSRGLHRRGPGNFTRRLVSRGRPNGPSRGHAAGRAAEIPATNVGQRVDRSFHREPSQPDRGDPGLVPRRGQRRSRGSFRLRALV